MIEKEVKKDQDNIIELKNILSRQEQSTIDLQTEIKQNYSDIAVSETSNLFSRLPAKFARKKDMEREMLNYNSEERSEHNQSLFKKSFDPSDDIIDRDPRLRNPNFYQDEPNDFFGIEKATHKQKIQEHYQDEEYIYENNNNEKNIDGGGHMPIIKLIPGLEANEPLESPVIVAPLSPEVRANKKINAQDKNLNEFHELINKTAPEENTDIHQQIKNFTSSRGYSDVEELDTSITSAHRIIKKKMAQEIELYNSEERSVQGSIMKYASENPIEEEDEGEPELSRIEFKEN